MYYNYNIFASYRMEIGSTNRRIFLELPEILPTPSSFLRFNKRNINGDIFYVLIQISYPEPLSNHDSESIVSHIPPYKLVR